MLLLLVGGLSTSYFLYLVITVWLKHRKYAHIPGPKRDGFFIGNMTSVKRALDKEGNYGVWILQMMIEYGDCCVFWIATEPHIIIGELTMIKEYYTNLKIFRKPDQGLINLARIGKTDFLGNYSILGDTGGPNWEKKKRILDPGFKISKLQTHIKKFYEIGETVAEIMEKRQTYDGHIDFSEVIAPYTIHAISSAGFSVLDDKTLQELSTGAQMIANYWVTLFGLHPLRKTKLAAFLGMDSPDRPIAESQLKYVRELGRRLMMTRIDSGKYGRQGDALDFIIKANETDGNLNMERAQSDFMAMYEAGNVTTATTLSFFIAEMVRNTDVLDKCIEEVDRIWVDKYAISASSTNEDIVSAIKDMTYLEAVVNEVLRRHPPVVIGLRQAEAPIKVAGYKIPKMTRVLACQQALHHHPKYWDDPEKFDPTRFLEPKLSQIKPFTFVPFIVGPRRCLGKNFALLEMKVFLGIWLSRLTFEKMPGTPEDIPTEQSLLVRLVDNRVLVRMR